MLKMVDYTSEKHLKRDIHDTCTGNSPLSGPSHMENEPRSRANHIQYIQLCMASDDREF